MEKLAAVIVKMDDQVSSATDGVKPPYVRLQIYSLMDIVQGNKGHPAHDLHQSSFEVLKNTMRDKILQNN